MNDAHGEPLAGDELERPRGRHRAAARATAARARRPSRRARPPCRPSPPRTGRSRRRGTARARPTAAASRDRTSSTSSGLRDHRARRRAAAAAARPTAGCTRAAATRPGRSTRARGRASGRRRGAPSPGRPSATSFAKSASTTSTTSRSPARICASESAGAAGQRHRCALEERRQRRRVLGAARRQLELARPVGLRRDQVEDEHEEDRAGERGRQRASPASCAGRGTCRRAPCATAMRLAHRAHGGGRECAAVMRHAASPSPLPSSVTNASSSVAAPLCAISSARGAVGDDAAVAEDHDAVAQRRDFLHHVRAEQQALAGAAQVPELLAQRAHAHDVEAVGGLVEQDRVAGRARARARSRPSSARPARSPARAGRRCRLSPSVVDQLVDARSSAAPDEAVQRAVVADVLARGQPRVEAARVGQHADALAHRVAVAHDVEAVDRRACRRRARSASRACAAASSCPRRWGRAGR